MACNSPGLRYVVILALDSQEHFAYNAEEGLGSSYGSFAGYDPRAQEGKPSADLSSRGLFCLSHGAIKLTISPIVQT